MIIVYVKHYLTKAGINYVDQIWFQKVKSITSQQPGFVALERHAELDKDDCINVTVKFIDEEKLVDWTNYPEHDDVVNELDKFRSRDYWEAARTESLPINSDALIWQKIEPATLR